VIVHAGGDERMGELEQNRTAPTEQDDTFGVDAVRDGRSGTHDPVPLLSPDAGPLPLDFVSGRVLRCHIQPATPKIASPNAPRRTRLHPLVFCGDNISR